MSVIGAKESASISAAIGFTVGSIENPERWDIWLQKLTVIISIVDIGDYIEFYYRGRKFADGYLDTRKFQEFPLKKPLLWEENEKVFYRFYNSTATAKTLLIHTTYEMA